jgi:hypothetical protein
VFNHPCGDRISKKAIEEAEGIEQIRLLKRKKELQIRQLWNIDQLETLDRES